MLWGPVFEETGELTYLRHLSRQAHDRYFAHVRPAVVELLRQPGQITWAQYREMRGNSYEHKLLRQKLDDDGVLQLYQSIMAQIGDLSPYALTTSYPEAIVHELAPLMAKRLQERIKKE